MCIIRPHRCSQIYGIVSLHICISCHFIICCICLHRFFRCDYFYSPAEVYHFLCCICSFRSLLFCNVYSICIRGLFFYCVCISIILIFRSLCLSDTCGCSLRLSCISAVCRVFCTVRFILICRLVWLVLICSICIRSLVVPFQCLICIFYRFRGIYCFCARHSLRAFYNIRTLCVLHTFSFTYTAFLFRQCV